MPAIRPAHIWLTAVVVDGGNGSKTSLTTILANLSDCGLKVNMVEPE
jgi:hypothetical protein